MLISSKQCFLHNHQVIIIKIIYYILYYILYIIQPYYKIVNVACLCDNITQSPSNGVYISQLTRFARASTLTFYNDFFLRCRLSTIKGLFRLDASATFDGLKHDALVSEHM